MSKSVEPSRRRAGSAKTVLLLAAIAARSMSRRPLGSKLRRRWLVVNAGDEHLAAPSDWMARRGCTLSCMHRPSHKGRDRDETGRLDSSPLCEDAGSGPLAETVRGSAWPCPV